MIIAVEGCAHGELEIIYDTIAFLEDQEKIKVDVLLCCGDFQATRNLQDLQCMAVPDKYKSMCTFYKYYSGEKTAPILTIFIGGNHEASNYLAELAYGGWVAPNIYYLGYAGIVDVKGIRIAGLSGIYKGFDYMMGHFEKPPYDGHKIRSAYHVRNQDVFRLKQVGQPVDIVMSHDWPLGIHKFGDVKKLLKNKPFFRNDISNNQLGSKPAEDLLHHLQPSYWFSAHLHCKFAALVEHSKDTKKTTRFLALDKCLPKKKYLQILDIPTNDDLPLELKYDLEWLTILHFTNHLLSVEKATNYMPGPLYPKRWNFTPTKDEMEFIHKKFNSDLKVPLNFTKTVTPYDPSQPRGTVSQPAAQINPQTISFCDRLGIDDPMALLLDSAIDVSQSSSQTLSCSLPAERSPPPADLVTDTTDDSIVEDNPTSQDRPGSEEVKWFVDTSRSAENPEQRKEQIVWENKGVVKRLSGLSLPPPLNENLMDTKLTSNYSLNDYQSPISKEPPTRSTEEVQQQAGDADTPTTKKLFKRRNQSLYTPCDDD